MWWWGWQGEYSWIALGKRNRIVFVGGLGVGGNGGGRGQVVGVEKENTERDAGIEVHLKCGVET